MEKLIQEIQKTFPLKDTTKEKDIVLVVFENPQTMLYARVKSIERDNTKEDEWWHLKMHVLSMPPQEIVWTLRAPQFTGKEIFTMGGDKRYIHAVDFKDSGSRDDSPETPPKKPRLRVVK